VLHDGADHKNASIAVAASGVVERKVATSGFPYAVATE
jgi:hypothetical protein